LEVFIIDEVQARQTLNAEYALHILERENNEQSVSPNQAIRWLLHIDIDELFYMDGSITLDEHLEFLDQFGAQAMTYANHEGVPETFDCVDYFTDVTLFRKHHFCVPMSRASDAAMQYWRQRRTHGQYMLTYDNGKSAVRVGAPGAVPMDVHRFELIERGETARLIAVYIFLDFESLLWCI
jgi:hypothetical protein